MNKNKTKAPSFPRILARSLAGCLMLGSLFSAAALLPAAPVLQEAPSLAPAEGSPARLLADNDCWAGHQEPKAAVPGHVVYRGASGDWRLGGPAATGRALEQIFEGADHGLEVAGFCK